MAPTPLIIAIDGRTPEVDAQAWVAPTAVLAGAVHARCAGGCLVRHGRARRHGDDHDRAADEPAGRRGRTRRPRFPGDGRRRGQRRAPGRPARLHDRRRTRRRTGAVVLNGARVGAGTLIAAGAVVLEGAEIPPGSLVAGLPGKVRRELTDDERAAILRNAQTYCVLARTHAAAG